MNTINIPRILLPNGVDMHKWAVNACDQYTSDHEYWRDVEDITKGVPSAYNLIFPEIYLEDSDNRISRINKTMREYLLNGVFKEISGGFILVERTTDSGTRRGIVLAIDLEDYSYKPEDKALIRSTEATILERIPPRVEIRKNAPVELPHVMLLYDDKPDGVLNTAERGEILYDFDLMKSGGHVKGTYIKNAEEVRNMLYALCTDTDDKLLFAVGDGNHSLATAKTCWENLKKKLAPDEIKTHPARFALVEAVNIYDSALEFKPIHRYIKTNYSEKFLKGYRPSGDCPAYIVVGGRAEKIHFNSDIPQGIRELDKYIENFISENGGEVDYIHGEEDLISLTKSGGVGIILPAIEKSQFFSLIKKGGNLPRKTFSMGEGYEKRYYIEARIVSEKYLKG